MRILYLLKKEPSETLQGITKIQSKRNEVRIVKLNEVDDFKKLVEDLFKSEKVICW
ncbi:MAG: hypothetical protein ACE5FU_08370 [Nitrospinota bacterium]